MQMRSEHAWLMYLVTDVCVCVMVCTCVTECVCERERDMSLAVQQNKVGLCSQTTASTVH